MKHIWTTALISTALTACSAADPLPPIDLGETPITDVTLYAATVLTVDEAQPQASGVAIANGSIIAVGDFDDLSKQLTGATIDRQYADHVILPGLIDPHVHMVLGAMMYGADMVPPWDVPLPGDDVKGLKTKADLLARITEIDTQMPEGAPLILWGYHDLVQGDVRRTDLDAINSDRPIILWHWSGHDFYLNSAAIDFLDVNPTLAETFHGVELDSAGDLTGRIYEDALQAIFPKIATVLMSPEHIDRGWQRFEALLTDAGVTTVADMGYGIFGRQAEDYFTSTYYNPGVDGYRLYRVPEHRAFTGEFGDGAVDAMLDLTTKDPTVLPQVKLFSDAAFYSQTMKLRAPGYTGGQSQGSDGLYVTQPEDLPSLMAKYWDAGLDIHIHSNGDAAQDSVIAALKAQKPASDGQRLIIEHGALITPDQITEYSALPVGISAASHYVRYMGSAIAEAIGEKAEHLSPLNSTSNAGMPTTLHSDAPLAPPYPLLAAQAHRLRDTENGSISVPSERLSAAQALRAITLDAAWSLGLEAEIGSIEAGKRADFTIVDRNPLTTEAEDWDEIQVLARIKGGQFYSD